MRLLALVALLCLANCSDYLPNPATLVSVTAQTTIAATDAVVVSPSTSQPCPGTDYTPTSALPIEWTGAAFVRDEQPLPVHSIVLNDFMVSGQFGKLVDALRLISDAGFNTITVSLAENEATVIDRLFSLAANYSLYVILSVSPNEVLAFNNLAARYAHEPALLMWEITRQTTDLATLTQLANTRIAIRACGNRPIMAAWESDLAATAPLIDILGIIHLEDYEALRQKFAAITAISDKPLFLARIGYDVNIVEETGQRSLIFQALEEAANYDAIGWTIMSAFDMDDAAFGVWYKDNQPRLVLEAIQRIIAREKTFTP